MSLLVLLLAALTGPVATVLIVRRWPLPPGLFRAANRNSALLFCSVELLFLAMAGLWMVWQAQDRLDVAVGLSVVLAGIGWLPRFYLVVLAVQEWRAVAARAGSDQGPP
jgi:hypothetical protein